MHVRLRSLVVQVSPNRLCVWGELRRRSTKVWPHLLIATGLDRA